MSLLHWNYLSLLLRDLRTLSRYIEFCSENTETYSIENARLIMSATQEVDILLKALCKKHGNYSRTEEGYRKFLSKKFPEIMTREVVMEEFNLKCVPFSAWENGHTPEWWTGNNKIKHERTREFQRASLGNVINSLSALLIVNIYYYVEVENNSITPSAGLYFPGRLDMLYPVDMVGGHDLSANGTYYKL